jgi:hypothetical protein
MYSLDSVSEECSCDWIVLAAANLCVHSITRSVSVISRSEWSFKLGLLCPSSNRRRLASTNSWQCELVKTSLSALSLS